MLTALQKYYINITFLIRHFLQSGYIIIMVKKWRAMTARRRRFNIEKNI